MLSRIAQHSKHTLTAAFEPDATAPVTIGIETSDGTELVAADTGTAGAGPFTYELTPAQTADLDRITAQWTDADGQIVTTHHDIVGAHLISLAQLRTFDPLDDETTYSDEALRTARDLASYALERACNRAFTPRYGREVVLGTGTAYLPLKATLLRSVTSVQVGDADPFGADALATVYAERGGHFYKRSGLWEHASSITVEYIHGDEVADPHVTRAIGLIAADILYTDALGGDGSAIPDRATSISSEAGTFSMVTAGVGGAAFGLPEVEAVVQAYRIPA